MVHRAAQLPSLPPLKSLSVHPRRPLPQLQLSAARNELAALQDRQAEVRRERELLLVKGKRRRWTRTTMMGRAVARRSGSR